MPHKEWAGRKRALSPSADWPRMAGVGCFGKPATLINMLHRVMAQYERGAGRMEVLNACPSPVGRAARHLMQRLSMEGRASGVAASSTGEQGARVAGFFFYMGHDRARLSVFTRNEAMPPFRSV